MIFRKTRETVGFAGGYALGLLTGSVSFLRQSRMFHPNGITFLGRVKNLSDDQVFPPYVLLRLSSAWWKTKEWKDVLGIALRFSESPEFSPTPRSHDQDLLFATIRYPWTMPFAPLSTKVDDFLANEYFAVTPFNMRLNSRKALLKFKLVPKQVSPDGHGRAKRFEKAVSQNLAAFDLDYLDLNDRRSGWHALARIEVLNPLNLNQALLKFNPFRTGLGIHPRGLVHFLRIGAYALSQRMRPDHAEL